MPKGFEPWIAVKVGVRKNRKLAGLPDDTARYGWIAGVLAEAKLQRPGGRFDSRGQLEEAIGRFAAYVDVYLEAGLLEVAGRLCSRCRPVWKALPAGSYVVHDWRAHQRDPFSAARVEAWRDEHSSEPENDDETNDERSSYEDETTDETTDERPTNADDSQNERATNTVDSPDVTADSPARGERAGRHAHETVDRYKDSDSRDSPQPPSKAGGRRSRANGTSPRQVAGALAASVAVDERARAAARRHRQNAVYRGALTERQRDEMNAADTPLEEIPGWAEYLETIAGENTPTIDRPDWARPKPAKVAS